MCMAISWMRTKNVKLEDCLSVTLSLACVGIVDSGSSVGTKAFVDIKEKQVDCDQKTIGLL